MMIERQENKLTDLQQLDRLLHETRDLHKLARQRVQAVILQQMQLNGCLYIGRIVDSCIYHIGWDALVEPVTLKFATNRSRNEFADTFEACCRKCQIDIQKSY